MHNQYINHGLFQTGKYCSLSMLSNCEVFYNYICLTYLALTLKAILQVLIYKALYDKSYLGSKTTMTSGEWTCLISFATAPLTCSERGGSEKIQNENICLQRDSNPHPPVHDREVAAP